ncbi:MAG: hypothetical protein IRZ05_11415 [Micromonosporaceae bacterium]|nr:hypothetical protein [Micromonosporaceae bacterium]
MTEEAMKKAAVAWVSVSGQPALALWCLPLAGSLYVVTGPGEQSAPGLATATEATVTLRGDHGGRIVTWPATASRVEPGTEEWETVAPQLAAKRLNAPGTAEELAARWASECVVTRLTPAGPPTEAGASLPDGSLAAAPRPSPAARRTPKPFRLHRIRPRQ